jgi:uncharacterized protein involved in response to NO
MSVTSSKPEFASSRGEASLPLIGRAPEPAPGTRPFTSKGFRPFFLVASAFAALLLPIWLFTLAGVLAPGRYLDAITWHAHEMIFGFTMAVIAGFLLTAVGNWTGRETLVGTPLLATCALWVAGRIAIAAGGWLPRGVPALVDLAFVPVLVVAIARPLWATKNRRNFVMVAVLLALWAGNLVVHLDALGLGHGHTHRALITSIDVVVLLMVVISGRVVPMFTKGALGDSTVHGRPALDKVAIAAMLATVLLDATTTDPRLAGAAAGLTALAVVARAWTWGTPKTGRVPFLWILHAGHAWLAVGLGLRAVAAFTSAVPAVLATHALTVGAIGSLTLGMMARVSLGHTGRPVAASRAVTGAFVLLTLAAAVRVGGPLLDVGLYRATVYAAGILWTLAFAIFVVVYAPILTTARADGKRG